MIKTIGLLIGILLAVGIYSCSSDSRICTQIKTTWEAPSKSVEKLDYLYQLLQSNPNCLDSITLRDGVFVNDLLNKDKLSELYFEENIDTSDLNVRVKLFLENSESMWGYFRGQTDCEIALSKILVHSGYVFGKDDMNLSFITDIIDQQELKGEVTDFMLRLDPKHMRVGNYRNTQIADIIKTVLNNTQKNDLSILVSDCIYSLEKGKNKVESVNFEWALIEEAFLNLLNEADYSVQINKYMSNFKGNYYALNPDTGGEIKLNVGFGDRFERPYYVIVIGETKLLKNALNEINFSEYEGFQNSYFITQPRPAERINYKIINSLKKGSFRPDKKDPKHSMVKARKGNRGPDKDLFQFTIAANLSGIGVENDYLLNESKYQISSDYSISVKPVHDKLINQDPSLREFTHLLVLTSIGSLKEESIVVSLKRETPNWIEETNIEDDRILDKKNQHKTRGFKNLIDGIESAFNKAQRAKSKDERSNQYYFSLTTKINL